MIDLAVCLDSGLVFLALLVEKPTFATFVLAILGMCRQSQVFQTIVISDAIYVVNGEPCWVNASAKKPCKPMRPVEKALELDAHIPINGLSSRYIANSDPFGRTSCPREDSRIWVVVEVVLQNVIRSDRFPIWAHTFRVTPTRPAHMAPPSCLGGLGRAVMLRPAWLHFCVVCPASSAQYPNLYRMLLLAFCHPTEHQCPEEGLETDGTIRNARVRP